MGEVLGKAKRRREFLLILIPIIVPLLGLAGVSFGLDQKLVWIPSIVLMFWPIYLLTERFPEEEPELSFLQSVRATIYFVDLLFLIPANGLLINPANLLTILFIAPIAAVSAAIDLVISRGYRDEVVVFNKEEKRLFTDMILKTGAAPIWLSFLVILADGVIMLGPTLVSILISVPVAFFLGYKAYKREISSASLAQELADQLKKSRWQHKLIQRKRFRKKK